MTIDQQIRAYEERKTPFYGDVMGDLADHMIFVSMKIGYTATVVF